MNKITFTKEGFKKAEKDLAKLLIDRVDAVGHLKKSRELGDLSENGYYKASRMKLSFIDRQIRVLNHQIKYSTVVSPTDSETVGIGNTVVVSGNDQESTYQIVGETEADPSKEKISVLSPLGSALFAKRVNDTISYSTPKGIREIKIKSIK